MPIYEYQCAKCGHQIEVLQKVSDEPLRRCEACGEDALNKLISATNFQLKGSGWYKAAPTDTSAGHESGSKGAAKSSEGDGPVPTSGAESGGKVADKSANDSSSHNVKGAAENNASSKTSTPAESVSSAKSKKEE